MTKEWKCDWKRHDVVEPKFYDTSCGKMIFMQETVKEMDYQFCPRCGRTINEIKEK